MADNSSAPHPHEGHSTVPQEHPNDPLHGITLAKMLERMVDYWGWQELGRVIPIRCFTHDPSVSSSLKFLRRTPWARAKIEAFYLDCSAEIDAADVSERLTSGPVEQRPHAAVEETSEPDSVSPEGLTLKKGLSAIHVDSRGE